MVLRSASADGVLKSVFIAVQFHYAYRASMTLYYGCHAALLDGVSSYPFVPGASVKWAPYVFCRTIGDCTGFLGCRPENGWLYALTPQDDVRFSVFEHMPFVSVWHELMLEWRPPTPRRWACSLDMDVPGLQTNYALEYSPFGDPQDLGFNFGDLEVGVCEVGWCCPLGLSGVTCLYDMTLVCCAVCVASGRVGSIAAGRLGSVAATAGTGIVGLAVRVRRRGPGRCRWQRRRLVMIVVLCMLSMLHVCWPQEPPEGGQCKRLPLLNMKLLALMWNTPWFCRAVAAGEIVYGECCRFGRDVCCALTLQER